MVLGATDGGDDAFTDSSDDGLFSRTTDEACNIRSHGNAGAGLQLDAVLRYGVDGLTTRLHAWAINDLWVNAGLDSVKNVSTRQVNGSSAVPRQVDLGLVCGDHRAHDTLNVSAGKEVTLQLI